MFGASLIRCICNNQTPDGMFNLTCSGCGHYVHGICYHMKSGPITCVECQGSEKEEEMTMTENTEMKSLLKRLAFSLAQGEHKNYFGEEISNNVASVFLELRFNLEPDWARKLIDVSLENMVLIIRADGVLEFNTNFDFGCLPYEGKEQPDLSTFLKIQSKDPSDEVDCKGEVENVNIKKDPDSVAPAPAPEKEDVEQNQQTMNSLFDSNFWNNVKQLDPKDQKIFNGPEIKLEASDESFDTQSFDANSFDPAFDPSLDASFDNEMPYEEEKPKKIKRTKLKKKRLGKSSYNSSNQGPIKCEDCDFIGANKTSVRRHKESVHLKIRYKCPHCTHEATRKGDLKQHILSVHEGKKYNCDQCGASLSHPVALKNHIRQIHEGKRYYCDQCNKDYSQPAQLKAHIKTVHEGVMYMCDQCPYQGPCKYRLAEHKKFKHEGIRYPCELCTYQAPSTKSLNIHKRHVHSGIRYPCDVCTYTASTPGAVKMHKEVKHEGKVYPCNQCNYSSPFKYKTNQHILTQHEGVRYTCDLCSYKTAHAGEVLKHKKKAHRELFQQ